MSNFNSLKTTINTNIRSNGVQAITGSVLNSVLNGIVDTLGDGYRYKGVVNPSSAAIVTDDRVFVIACIPGTYLNFKDASNNGIVVNSGEVAVLKYDTSWSKELTGIATKSELESLDLVDITREESTDHVSLVNGYFDGVNNNKSTSSAFKRSAYLPVVEGDVFTTEGSVIRYVWGQLNGVNVPSAGRSNVQLQSYVVPAGIDVLVISGTSSLTKVIQTRQVQGKSQRQVVVNTQHIGSLENLQTQNRENLVGAINEVDSSVKDLDIIDFPDKKTDEYNTLNIGYIHKDGSKSSASTFKYVNISVGEGDVISADRSIRFVCAYNGTNVLESLGEDNVYIDSYVVPAGVDRVAVSASSSVSKFTRTYDFVKHLPSQVVENTIDLRQTKNVVDSIFYDLIKSPMMIGWREEGNYTLGRAIASQRLWNELSEIPLVNQKLNDIDAYENSAGYCVCDGGFVYVLKYQNHVAGGSNGEPEYLNLVKINANNGEILNNLQLFYNEDIQLDGESYHCARIYQGAFVVGDKIKIIASSSNIASFSRDNRNVVICATINKSTMIVESYKKCYITEGGNRVLWAKDGAIDPLIVQTSIKDGVMYSVCKTITSDKYAIVKSLDFVNFEVVCYLPQNDILNAYGEFGIDCFGNYCHVSCRINPFSGELGFAQASSASSIILKYDMRTWKLLKVVKVASGMSMTTFFRANGNLYCIVCGADNKRNFYRFIEIDESYLENSSVIADTNDTLLGANTIIGVDSDGNLFGCKTGLNLILLKFHIPTFTYEEAHTLADFLISQL